MSRGKKIIIPKGSINPNETVVIKIPPHLRNDTTILAARRSYGNEPTYEVESYDPNQQELSQPKQNYQSIIASPYERRATKKYQRAVSPADVGRSTSASPGSRYAAYSKPNYDKKQNISKQRKPPTNPQCVPPKSTHPVNRSYTYGYDNLDEKDSFFENQARYEYTKPQSYEHEDVEDYTEDNLPFATNKQQADIHNKLYYQTSSNQRDDRNYAHQAEEECYDGYDCERDVNTSNRFKGIRSLYAPQNQNNSSYYQNFNTAYAQNLKQPYKHRAVSFEKQYVEEAQEYRGKRREEPNDKYKNSSYDYKKKSKSTSNGGSGNTSQNSKSSSVYRTSQQPTKEDPNGIEDDPVLPETDSAEKRNFDMNLKNWQDARRKLIHDATRLSHKVLVN